MFIYNDKTFVNMPLKMLELFRTIKADKEVKENAKYVSNITLSNILSPDRTDLQPSENVKEIYIFDIKLNSLIVPSEFVEALNKSVNFQTLFRLHYNDKIKYITSIKIYYEEKIKVLKMFETDFIEKVENNFPITLQLETVFKNMIGFVSQINFKLNEGFNDYVLRTNKIKKLQLEIEKQTKTMNNEKQPNIRMKLNDEIKLMKKELQNLM